MLGVRLGVVGILAREDVKILTVYVDLSVICVVCHSLITPLVSSNISPRRTEINVDILLFGGFHYLILFVYIMPI
jgi:hypothetical protein